MYKCQANKCKKSGGTPITPPRQPANLIITERRPKTYKRTIRRGRQKGFVEEIQGWEIAKEIKVCAICYEKITGLKPATAGLSLKQVMAKPVFKKKKPQKYKKKKNSRNFSSKNRKPQNGKSPSG